MADWGQEICCLLLVLVSLTCVTCDFNGHHGDQHQVPPSPQPGHPAVQARFDRNHIQNQEHIMEHYEGILNKPESEMTEAELQFHYFKLHDYDNNSKLDGIEIINAMTHSHSKDEHGGDQHQEARMPDEELIEIIDGIMVDEDINKDGYIDYSEFVSAQRSHGDNGEQQLNVEDPKDTQAQPVPIVNPQ